MTNKRRGGLGSGLGALLPGQPSVRDVPTAAIRPNPHQPREQFDEQALADLARSIQEHGILQPLLVTARDEGYELIAGERRWRAATQAGLSTVPVIVKEVTAQELLELAIIENVQRADLNPLEEARAYQALKDEFGLSDARIAELVGQKKRETVANARRLLNLPLAAQQALLDGRISAGHGRALLMIKHDDAASEVEAQLAALERVLREGLSVRQLEQLAVAWTTPVATTPEPYTLSAADEPPSRATERAPAPHAQRFPDDEAIIALFERALGTRVLLQRGSREHRLVIMFYSEEELQGLYDRLNQEGEAG
jgi:ParB family transcriptional regulator, chromosome partitioning protein